MVETVIILPNIEGKIWNLEYKINEIWQELIANGQATISLNNEGPCADGLGLYDVLDNLCQLGGFDKANITIITCNQLEQHPYYIIKRQPPFFFVKETQIFYQNNNQHLPTKVFGENFKHFSLLVGRSNWVRLWLAGNMYHNLRDKLLLSFHWSSQNEFQMAHLGLDDMLKWNANLDDINRSTLLLHDCPIIIDAVESYPGGSLQHLSVSRFYRDFFVDIVCETYFNGNSFFTTEKTWRALITRTPFIIHGPVNFLTNLKKLGFKTFDQWWNEDYDDYGHDLRICRILKLVDELAMKSLIEIENMYHDMTSILEHNFQRFMDLTPLDFQKIFYGQ